MPRKPEPSFELKLIIWDIATKAGKDNLSAIQRQLDYELEKRRKEGNFFEDTPDTRTIGRIIKKDINELYPEVVVSKLPRHIWCLRDDSEAIVELARTPELGTKEKQTGLTPMQDDRLRRHDERVFRDSDAVMCEKELLDFLLQLVERHSYYSSKYYKLGEFVEFFYWESNQYIKPELKELCEKLCEALYKLRSLLILGVCDIQLPKDIQPLSWEAMGEPESLESAKVILHTKKTNPEFAGWERELAECIETAMEAYLAYRIAVKETIFV